MRSGTTIGNRHTGETLTVLVSEEDKRGMQLYEVLLPPHRPSPPEHYHREFKETFTVISGQLRIRLNGSDIRLSPHESATAEIGNIHTFANDWNEPCRMQVLTQPPGGVLKAFRLAYQVANSGGAGADGLPRNPLMRLRFIEISQGFLPGVPYFLQRCVLSSAKELSVLTGLEKVVRQYLAD